MLQEVLNEKLSKMNDRQREAVEYTDGPLLILAGAGSGKTTVLINRIAYLLSKGLCAPYHILAITFTNKAAKELCDRIDAMMGADAFGVTAATFHSFCGRVLRAEIGVDGVFNSNYTIYDTDDGQRVVKAAMKALEIDDSTLPARSVQWAISKAKDQRVGPEDYCKHFGRDYRQEQIAKVYARYDAALREANALDFDDMILKTVELFERHPEILAKYAGRFRYIMVDEYQDTNPLQYRLVSLLSSKFKNICVVGDDDQSIYKFRGATIENILLFEEHFPNAKVIRLEQNYRSTANILDAANAVIAHNTQRKGKNLWTAGEKGEPIYLKRLNDDFEESRYIAETIQDRVVQGAKFSDFAILYRTNAQANSVERYFVKSAIPYKVVGGFRFYERKEIKDILAYLQVINNPRDDLRLKRIINEPKRKIGATTISHVEELASREFLPMLEIMRRAEEYPALSRAAQQLTLFAGLIDQLTAEMERMPLDEWVARVARESGYISMLEQEDTDEARDRINNIMELCSSVKQYQQDNPDGKLSGFLEEVSLMTDLDQMTDEDERVVLMTLHSAKGLEFNYVFMIGMEEGLFPSQRCMDDGELEEERRLMYVGVTRAKKCLYLLHARQRMLYGRTQFCMPSSFLKELPPLVTKDLSPKTASYGFGSAPSTKPTYANRGASAVRSSFASPTQQPAIRRPQAPASAPVFDFNCGDRVKHKTFGTGTLVSKTPMGSDFLLEVQFDTVGTKKIMANFAKLTKAEE